MNLTLWTVIILLFIIVCLFFVNKSRKEEIDSLINNHKVEKEKFDDQLQKLKRDISNGQIIMKNTSKSDMKIITEIRYEIAKQIEFYNNKYDDIYQKYIRLMRVYMLARKKSEVEVIAEIEKSICDDYEELGSFGLPATSYIASAMADFYTLKIDDAAKELQWMGQISRSGKIGDVRKDAAMLIERAKSCQYTFDFALSKVLEDNPQINTEYIKKQYGISLSTAYSELKYDEPEIQNYRQQISSLKTKCQELETKVENCKDLNEKCKELEEKVESFKSYKDIQWPLFRDFVTNYQKEFASNLTAIPYMSRIIADIMTIDLDRLAWSLSWGNNQERKRKVASLNALKKEKSDEIERIKGSEYQLAYLLELYPVLQDLIDTEFTDLKIPYEQVTDFDSTRRYLERDEWERLSETERNQLALNRYIESRKKSKWQIGRDYELYCGYLYEQKGFSVDYFGSYNGLEDLGRDLIVKKENKIRIVQCKYWSKSKQIHENHIMQLYGSIIEYNIENDQKAIGILITNTVLSEKAKEFAKVLGILYKENIPLGEFPRIKCNIGVDEFGQKTKIYHLPFDQQYDVTKIDGKEEFMALTVEEAENAGFRRAYKWFGSECLDN